MALSSRIRRWWRHPRQADHQQAPAGGTQRESWLVPDAALSRPATSGGEAGRGGVTPSIKYAGGEGGVSSRIDGPGGEETTTTSPHYTSHSVESTGGKAGLWRTGEGVQTPLPHATTTSGGYGHLQGGTGGQGAGGSGAEREVSQPWRGVTSGTTAERGVTTDRLNPLHEGQGHLSSSPSDLDPADLDPSTPHSSPPPSWTDHQQRVNSSVTGLTSGVTPDPGGGHGVNRTDLDLGRTQWSAERDLSRSTTKWTDLLTTQSEPTNQTSTSVYGNLTSSTLTTHTNSTSAPYTSSPVNSTSLLDPIYETSTPSPVGRGTSPLGEWWSSNSTGSEQLSTTSGGSWGDNATSWTSDASTGEAWGGGSTLNLTATNATTDANYTDPSSSSSTAFPGYLDLKDLTWDLSDYPDSLSMFANISGGDCGGWGGGGGAGNLSGFGCWPGAGGTANATNGTWLGGGSPGGSDEGSLPPRYWALLLVVFPAFTLIGNVLVVTSVYRERALRTVTNYFIVSLAIADIAVALFVMPLAIYTEVNNGTWRLGDVLCDAWVALDVMGCTSSILNLTAISVDRFIAVTQPIRYAKHKHSKRVHIMLALTWIVAIAISSPIALGMNYTEARSQTPELCIFYNSEFLICSSMGSFYIPCIIMLVLYWRIFRSIHLRAKKQALKMTKHLSNDRNMKNVIENKAQVSAVDEHALTQAQERRRKCPIHGSPDRGRSLASHHVTNNHETSFTNVVTTTDTGEDESHCGMGDVIKSPLSDDTDHVIPNDKSTEFMLSPQSEDSHGEYRDGGDTSGYSPPVAIVVETQFAGNVTSPTSPKSLLSPVAPRAKSTMLGFRNHAACRLNFMKREHKESPRKSVTKFNFHLRHSKKKKQSTAIRRERKATKTLAIVLGVFLFCWLPFFTVNVMNAICIKLDVMHKPECNIDNMLMSFFVWLGYINSFLNPVIYTIFNIEFRKAFKNILVNPLGRRL